MSINDLGEKVNPIVNNEGSTTGVKPKIQPFYTLLIVLVVASIFFALGRLSAINERKTPIKIISPNEQNSATAIKALETEKFSNLSQIEPKNSTPDTALSESGAVIGSKSGKKYYYPWCGTVKRINPENQVKFASIAEAKEAGFTPGGNCKGLK